MIYSEKIRELYYLSDWPGLLALVGDLDQPELASDPELLFFVASSFRHLGQPEHSLDAYRRALLLDPQSCGLRLEAASALQDLEDWSAAQYLLEGVIGENSEQSTLAEILRLRNTIYLDNPKRAEQHLLAIEMTHDSHFIIIGIALTEVNLALGRHDIAEQCLLKLLQLAPGSARGLILQLRLFSLGWHSGGVRKKIQSILDISNGSRLVGIEAAIAYERFKLLAEATATYQALIECHGLDGLLADAYFNYLANNGFLDDLKAALAAASSPPASAALLLARCSLEAGLSGEVSQYLDECPDDDRKLRLQAALFKQISDYPAATKCLLSLNARYPANPDIAFDLSLALLARGLWAEAWPYYEQRFLMTNSSYCVPAGIQPLSSDIHPQGRRVLVFGEQGIGDTVMMGSMLPDLLNVASSVVLFVQPRLAKLLEYSFAGIDVISTIAERDFCQFDSCYGMGSLPRFFRPSAASCSGKPYLFVEPACVDRWRQRLAELGPGLKIGLTWRGGAPDLAGQKRSITLEKLLPLLKQGGVNWVSLQNRHDPDEIERLRDEHKVLVTHFPGVADDIYETSGLIMALDLVITVQQSALHLAGALGQPAWVLLPAAPEWRYGLSGSKMCWYDSVELFRQESPGDWSGPIEAVRSRLISWLDEPASQNEGQQLT